MELFIKVLQDSRKSKKGHFYVVEKPEQTDNVIYEIPYELVTLSLFENFVVAFVIKLKSSGFGPRRPRN